MSIAGVPYVRDVNKSNTKLLDNTISCWTGKGKNHKGGSITLEELDSDGTSHLKLVKSKPILDCYDYQWEYFLVTYVHRENK